MMKKTWIILLVTVLFWTLTAGADATDSKQYYQARLTMVQEQIERRGITDSRVLNAMREVPRHLFVPPTLRSRAYSDRPLAIGEGQTISQPYIVALMTESLVLKPTSKVLEIGTGSGYQAAVLAAIAGEVYTIEIKKKLYRQAGSILRSLEYKNVNTRLGDGYYGWDSQQRFDAIMITAAVDHIPPPLLRQLKEGGRLVLPLGNPFSYQNLVLVTKKDQDFTVKQIIGVLFVPMTGHALEGKK